MSSRPALEILGSHPEHKARKDPILKQNWDGEMAQQLQTPAAFAEDLGLVPSSQIASYNHPGYQFQRII